jgi:hypothetical protein
MRNDKRVAAIMCFPNRERALDGMEVLDDLGYRCIERVDLVDDASDANTVFVEASKPLPAGTDEGTEVSTMLDQVNRAIEHLDGLAWEAGVFATDEEANWEE